MAVTGVLSDCLFGVTEIVIERSSREYRLDVTGGGR